RLDVSNVQIEVDAGYESIDSIILFEAKIGRRSDFNVRQLVYPFLQWSKRSKKKIRSVFLTYSNGVYRLTEFAFGSTMGDVRTIQSKAFVINDSVVAKIDLSDLLRATSISAEPSDIPFPQADDMDKVIDLVKLMDQGSVSRSAIAAFFEFDERQSDYYANAAAYLGFASRNRDLGGFVLTDEGRAFLGIATRSQRTKAILESLLRRPTMRSSIEFLSERNFDLPRVAGSDLERIIQSKTNVSNPATLARRARTVKMWLRWILNNSEIIQRERR
ncbi:MAG: hypothetical protein JSS86_09995, partial [Cyanobacteria bacterium SZAS LIN-2]|nr:hypothetical protein [Cyanobacteria bacterium SZAS LIN-2]